MTKIEQLIAEVRRLAKEQPDFIYERSFGSFFCKYTSGANCSGCIFGQAVMNLWPDSLNTLKAVDDSNNFGIKGLFQQLSIEATRDEIHWCMNVQDYQDKKINWGCCVIRADNQ